METRIKRVNDDVCYIDLLLSSILNKQFDMLDELLSKEIDNLANDYRDRFDCFCMSQDDVKEKIIDTFACVFNQKEIDTSKWLEPAKVLKFLMENDFPLNERKLMNLLDYCIIDEEYLGEEYHHHLYKMNDDGIYSVVVYEHNYEPYQFSVFDYNLRTERIYETFEEALFAQELEEHKIIFKINLGGNKHENRCKSLV